MLEIRNLVVSVGGKRIIKDVSLTIGEGETMALFGPNGSGKTTLLKAIMGFPAYRVESGRIIFKGEDVTALSLDERSIRGMGMAFQTPPAIRGVKLIDLMSAIMGKRKIAYDDKIRMASQQLNLEEFLLRDVNLGFSGGEMKRSELLQLMAQDPDFILLDEPDSGVDLENIKLVGDIICRLLGKGKARDPMQKSGLIITHQGFILDYVNADRACIMIDGTIRCIGNPRDILQEIRTTGYEECVRCQQLI